ncbi:hypothetical protein [Streptomyces hydrogenans]|uniref:Transposase n=1 Tax=Streptomyces hydrogenans TaxID=1873719 RepID=A0ABQ3PJF7_9ACTN|nr:hypothetical protein [Streptomyces hydrogenans]GHF94524.1 hypothetical protein GCM10018784_02740 [Streptomyces hydrogenans]GHI25148.1 hypothetical protein Shyd_65190 [Streptomyces hydrogenans]
MARPIQTLWLPGDEVSVLDFERRRAIKRDGRLTAKEIHVVVLVRACRAAKSSYSWWRCTSNQPCVFCEELAEFCQEMPNG